MDKRICIKASLFNYCSEAFYKFVTFARLYGYIRLIYMKVNTNNITICFFGFYDSNYSRIRIMMKGLRANGVHIIECKSEKSG